jgi:hypothetical protein
MYRDFGLRIKQKYFFNFGLDIEFRKSESVICPSGSFVDRVGVLFRYSGRAKWPSGMTAPCSKDRWTVFIQRVNFLPSQPVKRTDDAATYSRPGYCFL